MMDVQLNTWMRNTIQKLQNLILTATKTFEMNKIKERRKAGAVCPKCKSPDYKYEGRANVDTASTPEEKEYWSNNGKHNFVATAVMTLGLMVKLKAFIPNFNKNGRV